VINWNTGNLELESQNENQFQDTIEESKTMPKNIADLGFVTKATFAENSLSGFIERDSTIGKVEISSFKLSIKGLSDEHEQIIQFKLGEWQLLLNMLKYWVDPLKVLISATLPGSKADSRKLVKLLQKYVKRAESKSKGKVVERNDLFSSFATSKIVKKLDQNKNEGKRYLYEFFLPKVSVSYMHHNTEKSLSSDDVEHLWNTNFENWKLFIIRSMFRVEFNIHDPIPKKNTKAGDKKSKRSQKNKLRSSQKLLARANSGKPKSDESRSQDLTEDEKLKKRIVIKKTEVAQVEKAQKNIQFWFD